MSVLERFQLNGKRALITAGSRGLGFAMAKALAEAGARLVLVSFDSENLNRAKEELQAQGHTADIIQADLSKPDLVEDMCRRVLANHSPIDILINNVGGRRENTPLQEQSIADWQRLMDLNLTSAIVCTKLIGGPMIERRWGRIINIGSICGQVVTRGMHGRHYETAKAALAQFTRAVAADWAMFGVTVNAIAPGSFLTDANHRWFREQPELQSKIEAMIPMGRLGQPEELGPLAVYLASEASSYMTGVTLVIDGGFVLW